MIKIENVETFGWEAAIRGMRNPMNSWDKSDSYWGYDCKSCGKIERDGACKPEDEERKDCHKYLGFEIGQNDLRLMNKLSEAGNDHGKFLRMIGVDLDILAPLYWWKEFDTYKVGTVANSCNTMHKIQAKEFTLDNFSHEKLTPAALATLRSVVVRLEFARKQFLKNKPKSEFGMQSGKDYWWDMIQLLPSSYNQRRTVQLNYAVLKNMYHARKNHKLDEWLEFCKWVETLPYAKELIIGE
ncbi:hypothetical protein [Holdemania sp. 1001095H_141210_F2]|uniref:hypothetical protein n=1 Tax=Holdemania sp. 1001095H_141210_F2 TaxID=2787149 RepID=UPI0018A00AA6|nr:hypothetical protein [Holdemania sp. 1001095H_141210_F2]